MVLIVGQRRNSKGKYSDKKNLSEEQHEQKYVKQLAREYLEKTKNLPYNYMIGKLFGKKLMAGQLERMAHYIIKK